VECCGYGWEITNTIICYVCSYCLLLNKFDKFINSVLVYCVVVILVEL